MLNTSPPTWGGSKTGNQFEAFRSEFDSSTKPSAVAGQVMSTFVPTRWMDNSAVGAVALQDHETVAAIGHKNVVAYE